MLDAEGKELQWNRGYKYFGASKDLPGVKEREWKICSSCYTGHTCHIYYETFDLEMMLITLNTGALWARSTKAFEENSRRVYAVSKYFMAVNFSKHDI